MQNAAEFDGVGAGRQLLARYDGFSRQRNRSLRKTIEQLKHTSGTSMSDHIDLFEKICGQIASSGLPATEEEKIDWFLESVHEDTYHAIKVHCNSLKILGTLQFAQMIKLYALTCFAKYPHFQLRALGHKDATLTNNSITLKGRKRQGRNEGSKGKGRGPQPKGKGRGGRSKGKGSRSTPGKGRGWNTPTEETPNLKTKSTTRPSNQKGKTSQKPSTPFQGECSYCGIYGHQSRDCRKRIYAESKKTQRQTNNSVTATQVTFDADEDDLTGSEPDDETATLFQSGLTVDSDNEAQDSMTATLTQMTSITQDQTTRQMMTRKENTIPSLLTAFATSTIASSFRPMVLQLP